MISGHAGEARAEELRIRRAYGARREDGRYSWLDAGHLLMMQDREQHVLAALRRHGLASLSGARIVEIGCGTGHWIRDFVKWGASAKDIVGVDVLPERIRQARRSCAPAANLLCASAAACPLQSGGYDIVLQSTVFTSILDATVRGSVAVEMLRLVRRGGLILWYDFSIDNPRNPDVRGVDRGEIRRLFPGCSIELRRITLAPPIARAVARRTPLLASVMQAIPLLCTHYLGILHPS